MDQPIYLVAIGLPSGGTYYKVASHRTGRTLLEFNVELSGRRSVDYLKLDHFWGKVPRPWP